MSVNPASPSSIPAVIGGGGPSAQVKSAQAAFFRAALNEVQAAPARPATVESAQAASTTAPESPRLPRLGQLLDIRV